MSSARTVEDKLCDEFENSWSVSTRSTILSPFKPIYTVSKLRNKALEEIVKEDRQSEIVTNAINNPIATFGLKEACVKCTCAVACGYFLTLYHRIKYSEWRAVDMY